MVPAQSASHQPKKRVTKLERLRSLADSCPIIALVELIIAVGTKAISTNRPIPSGVENVFVPYDWRLISHDPAKAASVVPIAMDIDCNSKLSVIVPEGTALAQKDDTRIAGQMR
jgi:hypothetical protein